MNLKVFISFCGDDEYPICEKREDGSRFLLLEYIDKEIYDELRSDLGLHKVDTFYYRAREEKNKHLLMSRVKESNAFIFLYTENYAENCGLCQEEFQEFKANNLRIKKLYPLVNIKEYQLRAEEESEREYCYKLFQGKKKIFRNSDLQKEREAFIHKLVNDLTQQGLEIENDIKDSYFIIAGSRSASTKKEFCNKIKTILEGTYLEKNVSITPKISGYIPSQDKSPSVLERSERFYLESGKVILWLFQGSGSKAEEINIITLSKLTAQNKSRVIILAKTQKPDLSFLRILPANFEVCIYETESELLDKISKKDLKL